MLLFVLFFISMGALFYYLGGLSYLYCRYGFRDLEEEEKKLY